MRVAFLGPEGTFSEEALLAALDEAQRAALEPLPLATIYDCVMAVEDGRAERAIVPIESSVEGSVNATLDALVFETDAVRIVGEIVHPVRHYLIARERLSLDQVTRVVSHPQASGQCARYLRGHLGGAEVVSAASTADAVRLVAESTEPWAALGTGLAAELYGCVVLEAGVEDQEGNETRFVWLARQDDGGLSQDARSFKTSVAFWGLPDTPGSLVDILQEFAGRGVNLSKIESRPRKQGLGRYVFFADLAGAETDPAIAAALAAVQGSVETVRVLGCYPAAPQSATP
ncbi:MAG: prephenate dehydratase [Solirubrobacterales bacterium]